MPQAQTELKEKQAEIDAMRDRILDRVKAVSESKEAPTGEEIQEHKRWEAAAGEIADSISEYLEKHESTEVAELKDRLKEIEQKAVGQSKIVQREGEPEGFRNAAGKIKSYHERHPDRNLFMDLKDAGRDHKAAQAVGEFQAQIQSPERLKAWATGDLEDVDLILPDVQAALPFLAAQAKVVALCRELRTTSTSVEFPVYTSGLTVEHVAEGDEKPADQPTFELRTASIFTIAGLSEVPNSLLEDYATARGWIASELGRATGVQEDLDVLVGTGVGEPTGILEHSDITARAATDVNGDGEITGRDAIEATFRAAQDVRVDGLTEPTDIAMNPRAWTDIVLSFESNVGYLYGAPGASDAAPKGAPAERLLGLPVTLDAHIPNDYGGSSVESPIIVGNFQDAVVLRRSPFRIDVDTSLGFKVNTTWFRGEERMGFIVVRPDSFKVVTNVVPQS